MNPRAGMDPALDAVSWPSMATTGARRSPGDCEPFWIGPPSRALYAALHRPAGASATGVVVVPPLFDDLPRSRRFVTQVADELAEAGLPVLRFDYFGTGDSAGRGDAADFDSMRGDLDRAIASLRARTGARRVVLLAWRAAALVVDAWLARGGQADLVVWWDPLRDGAAWLANLEAKDAEARQTLPPPRPGVPRTVESDDGQLMGFRVSPRMRRDLEAARLGSDPGTGQPARWAVVHAEGDAPEVDRVFVLPPSAPKLASGVSMDGTLFITPQVREFVRALGPALARGGSAVASPPLPVAAVPDADVFVRFGPDRQLTGVLTGAAGSGPILLLPSAGLQPRSGPFRLHVELGERLAAIGMRTFRFDVPGVGEAPRLAGWDTARATLAAMDHLERHHGGRTFVVGGICSAADTGWDVATRDPRVAGVVLLDGLCHAGPWYRYGRVLGLLRRLPREWRRFARALRNRRQRDGLEASDFRAWPDREQARRDIAGLLERDTRLLFVYSGAYEECFLHPRQFEWTYGRAVRDPRVTMHYWPDCDHIYFGGIGRERLMATLVEWLAAPELRNAP